MWKVGAFWAIDLWVILFPVSLTKVSCISQLQVPELTYEVSELASWGPGSESG